jgi:hypothetical protein
MISGRRHPPKETIRSVDEKRKMDAGGGGYSDNVKSTSGMWNSRSCSPLRVGIVFKDSVQGCKNVGQVQGEHQKCWK